MYSAEFPYTDFNKVNLDWIADELKNDKQQIAQNTADIEELKAGGTVIDYEDLQNLPEINGVTLIGDKSLDDIGATSADEVSDLKSAFDNLDNAVIGTKINPGTPQAGYYQGTVGNTILYTAASGNSAYQIDLSGYIGRPVLVKYNTTNTSGSRVSALCDESGKIGVRYLEIDMQDNGFLFIPDSTYHVLYVSYKNSTTSNFEVYIDDSLVGVVSRLNNQTLYVSAEGSDANDGSYSNPVATVNQALKLGATTVLLFGGVYEQQIDLSLCKSDVLTIAPAELRKTVTFRDPDATIATQQFAVSGKTRVYSKSLTSEVPANHIWLFQENVPDVNTQISTADRMPLQRGKTYRCEDTKLIKTTATALSDAIDEIENDTDNYKFFVDTEGSKLYYSRPQEVSSTKPITMSTGKKLFLNNRRSITIKLTGINTLYMPININQSVDSEVSDCYSRNVYGAGCFTWDGALNAKFIRCEASRGFSDRVGDGFNASSTGSGDNFSKQCTATLIDCWSHDNNDDGYSNHFRCEDTLIGGLFENNGKSGVTPSFGAHATCYNVVSRYNWNGFYYIGAANDGGVNGQIKCICCLALNNNTHPTTYGDGFRVNDGNQMVLVDCKAVGNKYGYRSGAGSLLTAYDCKTANNSSAAIHMDSGTITIIDTTDLTA